MATTEAMTTAISGFSTHFTSQPFTVYIGPNKTQYHINRDILQSKIPYFAGLFSFPGLESSTNSCHLSTSVDTEEAFDMVLQFVYHGRYKAPDYIRYSWQAQSHAEVYLMAERLLMDDLMKVAVKQMARTLVHSVLTTNITYWDIATESWKTEETTVMAEDCIVQVLRLIYGNTKDDEIEEEKQPKEMGKENDVTDVKAEGDVKAAPESTIAAIRKNAGRSGRNEKDPMRRLLSKYCGAQLLSLKKMPGFLRVVEEVGAFARDLMMEILPRGEFTEQEAYAIS
ncbi:hypothetical protein EX30DRAFT_396047 [Ascodesmis nigricans]|uniref:BTB domain-containing protein n=1 Tax=Ascodesmis nigricans TaxID=341454 RepID=A0A4S2MWJ9_9PEZI|nr:hypothetical protein EX30DRAFT_396047 [Ascodesmis nigricans]